METRPTSLPALDGRPLAATRFGPACPPRGTVVVLNALAVPARFYRRFAHHLADAGYRVLTFDPRGIGGSVQGSLRGERGTLTDQVQLDYRAALLWLRDQPRPHFGVGHSLGGQLPGLLEEVSELDGLYTIAAQLAYWRRWPAPQRYKMLAAFKLLMPGIARGFGYLPSWTGLGKDVPRDVLLEWCRWLTSPGYFLDHVEGAGARMARTRTPIAVVGFTYDDYAPPNAVEAFARCLPAQRTELRLLDPGAFGLRQVGHFGAFRPLRTEGDAFVPHPVWADVLDHFDAWAEPGPPASG